MTMFRIGVIGYASKGFDRLVAIEMIEGGILKAMKLNQDFDYEIVASLTRKGIPGLAYKVAKYYGLLTAGVAPSRAKNKECCMVDREEIVGDSWGDELVTFITQLDCLIRVGGGRKCQQVVDHYRSLHPYRLVMEYNIPQLDTSKVDKELVKF